MDKMVYMVCTNRQGETEIVGIFTEEMAAVRNCTDSTFCVMPVELNKRYPDEQIECGYYPIPNNN
jgi:hypothetical protein